MVVISPRSSMEKPATGLPVFAMPSTTRPVQDGSIPMTTQAATFGVRSRADERAEEQLEILTELQPAVGMRQREGALDVVRHRFARGVRKVVERQNDYVIANADTSVFTLVPIEVVASHVTTFSS